jgi:hypothetical protein
MPVFLREGWKPYGRQTREHDSIYESQIGRADAPYNVISNPPAAIWLIIL